MIEIEDKKELEEARIFLKSVGIDPDKVARDGILFGEKINKHFADEAKAIELRKIIDLNKSGYAGILPNGKIVDRRKNKEAQPIPENKSLGIANPLKNS